MLSHGTHNLDLFNAALNSLQAPLLCCQCKSQMAIRPQILCYGDCLSILLTSVSAPATTLQLQSMLCLVVQLLP